MGKFWAREVFASLFVYVWYTHGISGISSTSDWTIEPVAIDFKCTLMIAYRKYSPCGK
jgi:hypothetical protein